MQAKDKVAIWCQKHYRGMRDRQHVSEALYCAIASEDSIGSAITTSAIGNLEPAPFREGVKYKIRRLQYLDDNQCRNEKRYVRPSAKKKEEGPRDGIMIHRPNKVPEKPKSQAPRPRAPRKSFLGYENKATVIKMREERYGRHAVMIQKVWRGCAARLYFKRAYKTLRHKRLQRERAAWEIQTWFKGSLLTHAAMDNLLDRKYFRDCTMKIQR